MSKIYKVPEENLRELEEAVLEKNKNAAHYYYDKILYDIANTYEPKIVDKIDRICYGDRPDERY